MRYLSSASGVSVGHSIFLVGGGTCARALISTKVHLYDTLNPEAAPVDIGADFPRRETLLFTFHHQPMTCSCTLFTGVELGACAGSSIPGKSYGLFCVGGTMETMTEKDIVFLQLPTEGSETYAWESLANVNPIVRETGDL